MEKMFGMSIGRFDDSKTATFFDGEFMYAFYRLSSGERIEISRDHSYTLYISQGTGTISNVEFSKETVINCLGKDLTLVAGNNGCSIFLVSARIPADIANIDVSFIQEKIDKCYRVNKPWGYEIWLSGKEAKTHAFKQIQINAGYKTSLQYHIQKTETNLLRSGTARLYGESEGEIEAVTISKSFITVPPPTIHRIEALEDIELLEASTPHLEDVVRIEDDSKRGNGRIESEHVQ